jgi:uncharacterized protein YdhG (YjbR/CyaY superfamily)
MATSKTTRVSKTSGTFSAEERAAMKERAAEARRAKAGGDGEADLLAKIREMKGLDKQIAETLHAIVKEHAPGLAPRTWYGMPAYAGPDGKAVVFFTPASKFKERYATLGFNAGAKLDEGDFWATSFAVTGIGDAVQNKIIALVKKAVG